MANPSPVRFALPATAVTFHSGRVPSAIAAAYFFFQAEAGIRDTSVTGVQTCALPISYALEGFYTQRDDPHPLSAYGASKLEGERRAHIASARTTVVRSGWIFGPGGKNFLATVTERARRGERLRAITDSWGTPTYSPDLAARLRELAEFDLPGVYHVVNSGEGASYEGFAREAARAAGAVGIEIEAVSMESLKRLAPLQGHQRMKRLQSEA